MFELCMFEVRCQMESMNPGGTGKDRAVKYMLSEARKNPNFRPGVDIYEGTSGSTGIALAFQCNSLGLKLHVCMPDDQAQEKRQLLEKLGATVHIVPSCAIANSDHYVNTARRLSVENKGIFIDQFENLANLKAHFESTGPEIWSQTEGKLDAFVMSAGTGGTIAGVSKYLKSKNKNVKVVLADCTGSSLLQKVLYKVCYTHHQSERTIKKHRYDSIVEGVGLDRITKNFSAAQIDTGYLVTDQEIVNVAHWVLKYEGLFVGSSSAMNIAAAIKYCLDKRGKNEKSEEPLNVVTVICDGGNRHLSRFWNPDYLAENNLVWPAQESLQLNEQILKLT